MSVTLDNIVSCQIQNHSIFRKYYIDRRKFLGDLDPYTVQCNTKEKAVELEKKLSTQEITAGVLHVQQTQNQRQIVMRNYRSGRIQVLIVTNQVVKYIYSMYDANITVKRLCFLFLCFFFVLN